MFRTTCAVNIDTEVYVCTMSFQPLALDGDSVDGEICTYMMELGTDLEYILDTYEGLL